MTFRVERPVNAARIQLDARCDLVDEVAGTRESYYLITPCKSERMYLEEGLFQDPNYDFCGVWSQREYLIIRTHASHDRDNRELGLNADRFTTVEFDIRPYRETSPLSSDDDIVRATLDGELLQAVTEIHDKATGRRAILEYPVKTMNVDPDNGRFQVDTGPLPWPDLVADVEQAVARFHRAFVAYNTFDRAEFVIERPTAVVAGDEPIYYTAHYSHIETRPARHALYAVRS